MIRKFIAGVLAAWLCISVASANFLPGWFPGGATVDTGAAFPAIVTTNTSGTTGFTSQTTHAAALPASISAGNLLLVLVVITNGSVARDLTTPTGWTELYKVVGSSSLRRVAAYYKTASGSEGASVDITASGAGFWAVNSYQISGWSTIEGGTASGSSASSDPPELIPSGGSAKTLWLAVSYDDATALGTPTVPSGYSDQLVHEHNLAGSNEARTTSARQEIEAASEDPAAFALPGSGAWVAATISISP